MVKILFLWEGKEASHLSPPLAQKSRVFSSYSSSSCVWLIPFGLQAGSSFGKVAACLGLKYHQCSGVSRDRDQRDFCLSRAAAAAVWEEGRKHCGESHVSSF